MALMAEVGKRNRGCRVDRPRQMSHLAVFGAAGTLLTALGFGIGGDARGWVVLARPGPSSSERVTGFEPALSAWDLCRPGATPPDLRGGVSVTDREMPLVTGVNGPLMARMS